MLRSGGQNTRGIAVYERAARGPGAGNESFPHQLVVKNEIGPLLPEKPVLLALLEMSDQIDGRLVDDSRQQVQIDARPEDCRRTQRGLGDPRALRATSHGFNNRLGQVAAGPPRQLHQKEWVALAAFEQSWGATVADDGGGGLEIQTTRTDGLGVGELDADFRTSRGEDKKPSGVSTPGRESEPCKSGRVCQVHVVKSDYRGLVTSHAAAHLQGAREQQCWSRKRIECSQTIPFTEP